jgi:hypothetical protein
MVVLSKARARREAEVQAQANAADAQDKANLAEVERLIGEEGMSWAEAVLIVTGADATKYEARLPGISSDPPWAAELREEWRKREVERRSRLRAVNSRSTENVPQGPDL